MPGLSIQRERTPAGQILEYLFRRGSAGIKDLEQALGVTATAIRQQLATLLAEGLVTVSKERSGVGRPRNIYRPTERAYGLYACHCDDLALTLLGELLETEGAEKLRALLQRVSRKLAGRYGGQITAEGIEQRVDELSALLGQRGIVVDVKEAREGVVVLHEYNCPYHELASVHRDVCEMERSIFEQALQAEVKLDSCIQDGDYRCQFVVSERPAANQDRAALN